MMNKYSLAISAMLVTLSGIGILQAQTAPRATRPTESTFTSEPVTLETPTAMLYGTLELPRSTSPVPVLLIIAGSGPTDRDGNSPLLKGPNNSLKLLAEGLASKGVASVRYDKRLIGETGKGMKLAAEKAKTVPREEDLTFENYIDDAARWAKQLRADRRFSSVIILGHSEGSLIGMVAAQRIGADAFISVAGSGRPIQKVILEQVRPQFSPALFQKTEEIFAQLAAGKSVESVPPELLAFFRPSIQPYMISWLRYDPTREITKLRVPVLIMQGTTDVQVGPGDAKALADANPAAKLVMVDGMNHVLKMVPKDPSQQVSSYSDPSLPIASDVMNKIVEFVGKVPRGAQKN